MPENVNLLQELDKLIHIGMEQEEAPDDIAMVECLRQVVQAYRYGYISSLMEDVQAASNAALQVLEHAYEVQESAQMEMFSAVDQEGIPDGRVTQGEPYTG